MENAIKIVRLIQIAMLLSVGIFVVAGEMVGSIPKLSNPTLFYALSLATITIVGVILVVRRTLVLQSAVTLAIAVARCEFQSAATPLCAVG